VRAKDFPDKGLGKVTPSGVYDLTHNDGWVSVGIDHNTAQFAAQTLRRWWREMGSRAYPKANRLLATADAGGSSGYRSRLWKVELPGSALTPYLIANHLRGCRGCVEESRYPIRL
jgi:hypothetical protein